MSESCLGRRYGLLAILFPVFLVSCFGSQDSIVTEISGIYPYSTPADNDAERGQQQLRKLRLKSREWSRLSSDLMLAFDGLTKEERGFPVQVIPIWEEVLRVGGGGVAKLALEKWVRLKIRTSPKHSSKSFVERAPFDLAVFDPKISKILKNREFFARYVKGLGLGNWSKKQTSITPKSLSDLMAHGENICQNLPDRLTDDLGAELLFGFNEYCRKRWRKARYIFERLDRTYPEMGSYQFGAALGKMIVLSARRVGDRESIANGYEIKSRYFLKHHRSLGSSSFYSGLEDLLWSARYLALLGYYDKAESRIDSLFSLVGSKFDTTKALQIRAEAAHILSFRVELERGNYSKAIRLTRTALSWRNLSPKWRQSLRWYLGYYYFLLGDYSRAVSSWTDLINGYQVSADVKEKVLFWLSRAYHTLGIKDKRDFYTQMLVEQHPLSFYSVVGLESAQIPKIEKSQKYSRSQVSLAPTQPGRLLNEPFYRDTFLRVQLAAACGYRKLTSFLLADLAELVKASGMEMSASERVYLAKLWYLNGDYSKAIRTVSHLSGSAIVSDPELISIFFPTPFSATYQRVAKETGVPVATLLAVTRQESLFDRFAKSPAHAFGLMQLILPTARSYSKNLTELDLYEPDTNILVAGRYLKDLQSKMPGKQYAIYAAYNAGEYAAKTWMGRRPMDDLLIFLESIPFSETRRYVKRVLRNQNIYKEPR